MSHTTIHNVLVKRLNTLGAVDSLTVVENVQAKPQQGKLWHETILLPGQTLNTTVDPVWRHEVGVMQVNVSGPKGAGRHDVTARAEAIRALFPRGLSLEEAGVIVRILQHPFLSASIPDDAWYRVPVTVPYFAEVRVT